jgi:serine protease
MTNDIIYHGGNVGPGAIGIEKTPAVYLVYWGPDWVTGFNTTDANGRVFSSTSLQNYLNSFFQNVGGSPWAAVQTQYCRNVPAGTTTCAGVPGADFITNPKHQLKGVWTDPTPVPDAVAAIGLAQNLVDDPIAMEAMRASAHFNYDSDATYIVLTPPQTVATGQPVYCGYHTQTTSVNGLGNPYRLQYAFMPYLNRDWTVGSCGANTVNPTSNSFGNGVWDGYSIVVGHEYSEAVTDPDNVTSIQDGWNDDQTSENADKCAWYHTQNITLAGHQYAIQPTWSNEAFDAGKDGCAVSR